MSKNLFFLISFVLVLGLIGTARAEPCDVNLMGWWKFDEGDGNTVTDSSAYNNNGVSVSPTPSWVTGSPIDPCNSAMYFDGEGDGEGGLMDYVVCAERDGNNPGTYPAELMPDTFTISCWVKLDEFTWYGAFVSNGTDGECGFFLQHGGNGNNFGLSMMSETGGWWDVETPTIYDTDRWYHLAATYDGQYATVYVDGGVAEGPEDVGGPIRWISADSNNGYPSNFVIGSWKDETWPEGDLPVDGIIDDVRFYNYALPPNDISVLAGIVPGAATNPNPRYGAKDASKYTDLSWTPGTDANSHDVYFGTLESEVTDANIDVNFGVYMGRQAANVFSNSNLVPTLELTKKYYWRIDEVNETAATLIKGRVWSFTVANYIVVDDMDSYGSDPALRAVWKDFSSGSLYGKNGAELFLETSPDYVIDGNSMGYYFRNNKSQGSVGYVGSEAEANAVDLEAGTDWTVSGVEALVLNFHGHATNLDDTQGIIGGIHQDQMYVAVEDGDSNVGVVKYPDMNDVKIAAWQEWNIDLQDPNFSDVNLADVAKVYIGFGGQKMGQTKAGAGYKTTLGDTVWFDDIRVWPPRCRTELVATDFTGDCITDLADVLVMSDDWLATDADVIAVEPCDVNLIGWWKFDEGDGNTVADSSTYNNNGATVHPTPTWVTGHPNDPCDSAMSFDGENDYYNVVCAERVGSGPGLYPAELMPDTFTIALWVKFDTFLAYAALITSGVDGECGFYLWSATDDGEGDFGLSMYTESEGWQDVMPTNIHDTGTWYHLAVSYDGQYANFYVDGLLIEGPQDVGGPIRWINAATGNHPDHFIIGAWEDAGWSQQVDGVIDEVRFYNYALQPGEIAVLAGLQGTIYVALDVPTNLVPKDPCDSEDPNLGTGAFDPNNLDIINFLDYSIMANSWLDEMLWPARP